MREDFDFVSMANYSADLKENTDRALAIHETQREEIRQLNYTIAAILLAAGGKVSIYPHHIDQSLCATVTRFYSPSTMAIQIEAKP